MKSTASKAVLGAVLAASAVAFAATSASARVVCNHDGDCWHTHDRVTYGQRLEVHPDDWYFHQHWDRDPHRHWRESHEGHGYYANGVWVPR